MGGDISSLCPRVAVTGKRRQGRERTGPLLSIQEPRPEQEEALSNPAGAHPRFPKGSGRPHPRILPEEPPKSQTDRITCSGWDRSRAVAPPHVGGP